MKLPIIPLLLLTFTLAGCGQKLSGRYEAVPSIPRTPMPKGTDPKLQRQMDDAVRKVEDMNRMTLEFDGSTVKMGSGAAVLEFKYRIKGQNLELLGEVMGRKMTIPMTIEADGSITYLGMSYRKVQ